MTPNELYHVINDAVFWADLQATAVGFGIGLIGGLLYAWWK